MHIDERLDDFFDAWDGSEIRMQELSIVKPGTSTTSTVFLRIDPINLRLYHLNNFAELEPIEKGLMDIEARINPAFEKLKGGGVTPLYQEP